jgi:hypothetical protein
MSVKEIRRGYTPDLYRSGNGPTMGGYTLCGDVRVVMKGKYCSSVNPVASKGLCCKSLCNGWCFEFVFKIPKFPNAR